MELTVNDVIKFAQALPTPYEMNPIEFDLPIEIHAPLMKLRQQIKHAIFGVNWANPEWHLFYYD